MARPKKKKIVEYEPNVTYFKPRAVPLNKLEEVEITIDELECLRLSNLENLNQIKAAKKMNIHQSTFQRTILRAEKKITDALVNGKAIKIKGGDFIMPGMDKTGSRNQGGVFGRGSFRRGEGITGTCVCVKCGHETTHNRAMPCNQTKCPECGSLMTRKEI